MSSISKLFHPRLALGLTAAATLWVAAAAPAHACRDHDGAASAKVPAAKVQVAADHAASHHAATRLKANGSGIRFDADAPARLDVGQTATITLRFPAAGIDGAVAQLRSPEGVAVQRADGRALGEVALSATEATTVALTVTALRQGAHYLDVTTVRAGRASVKQVALRVGDVQPQLKSSGRVETLATGERVKLMQGVSR